MSLVKGWGRLPVDDAGWHTARMAVQGAAEQAARQRVPGLAGALMMQVLAGLRQQLRQGVDQRPSSADDLVAEVVQDVKGLARRAAEKAARSAITDVASWQRLAPEQVSALESMALAAAEGAACNAVEAAGRVSVTLLAEAEAGPQRPSRLWARAAALVWLRWLASRRSGVPVLAEAVLRRILPERDRDCLLADLEEEVEAHVLPRCGLSRARAWYWRQALRSILPLGRMRLAALLGRLWRWIPS